jgi:hypothetical protein
MELVNELENSLWKRYQRLELSNLPTELPLDITLVQRAGSYTDNDVNLYSGGPQIESRT